MTIQSFEDIIAWRKARDLYVQLHKDFSFSKEYSLKDQLLGAALSISNNIAEGLDRGSNKELKQFLIIARGSAAEVRSMLLMVAELEILDESKYRLYLGEVKDVSRLLTGFIRALEQQNTAYGLQRTSKP